MFQRNELFPDSMILRKGVARLFGELDYEVAIGRRLKAQGTGRRRLDVFAVDRKASCNRTYWADCRFWNSELTKTAVEEIKSTMASWDISTVFVLTRSHGRSQNSTLFANIRILDFEGLQHLYGNEWFRLQAAKLNSQISRVRNIHATHFDRHNPCAGHRNLVFKTPRQQGKLEHFRRRIEALNLNVGLPWVEGYLADEPIKSPCNPTRFDTGSGKQYEFASVREYFRQMTAAALRCADEFEAFRDEAESAFASGLTAADQSSEINAERLILSQTPISAIRGAISVTDYENLLTLARKARHR